MAFLRNRHPADELADVRAEIKALQAQEVILRARLLAGDDLSRADFTAQIVVSQRERLNAAALKAHFGTAALRPFMTATKVQQVWLKARNGADKNTDKNRTKIQT